MKRLFCFWLTGLLLVPGAGANGQADRLLPASDFVPGWVQEGSVKTYTADDLFEYINGEAELYLQYGFRELISGFYILQPDGRPGVSADVYRMASPLEAFGIYTRYRGAGVKTVAVGLEGFIGPAQMMFCQGAYFVQLNASGTASLNAGVFMALARAISGNLPEKPEPLREFQWLKIDGFIPGSEKYIPSGVLGYAFFQKGLMAQTLLKDRPVRVFILLDDSPEKARQAVGAYENHLKEKGIPLKRNPGPVGEVLCGRDPLYGGVCLQARGRLVLGVADLTNLDMGAFVVQQLQRRVPGY